MPDRTDVFQMNAAPMRIGTVRLKVRDLERVSAFYQVVLGLSPVEVEDRCITLGNGARPLLKLEGDPALVPNNRRQAGLFHTAFLMPTRADLALWLAHATTAHVPLQGASDHNVSEAIYLADPEDNGIEVYADRPLSHWRGPKGEIRMSTDPLDVQQLLKSADGAAWAGFPGGGTIGHVHLQVGDTEVADGFYRNVLGFDITARYPGASFYGTGGYHHQLAGNVWNSRRAGPRPQDMAGLAGFGLVLRDAAVRDAIAARLESAGVPAERVADTTTLCDPWGAVITLN